MSKYKKSEWVVGDEQCGIQRKSVDHILKTYPLPWRNRPGMVSAPTDDHIRGKVIATHHSVWFTQLAVYAINRLFEDPPPGLRGIIANEMLKDPTLG